MVKRLIPLLLLITSLSTLAASYSDGKANYLPLEPAFVVNLQDGKKMRFMQVKVQLMTRDTKVITALEENSPAIRHELLMLLSHQSMESMRDVLKREQVRLEAQQRLAKVLNDLAGISSEKMLDLGDGKTVPSGLQAIYFTDFVIQ